MPKRWLILEILAVGFLAALIFAFTRPNEPSYNGRSLSKWIHIYSAHATPESDTEAAEAIEHIGTNAYPFLERWHRHKPPSSWLRTVRYWASGLPDNPVCDWIIKDRGAERSMEAWEALNILPKDRACFSSLEEVQAALSRLTNAPPK